MPPQEPRSARRAVPQANGIIVPRRNHPAIAQINNRIHRRIMPVQPCRRPVAPQPDGVVKTGRQDRTVSGRRDAFDRAAMAFEGVKFLCPGVP